MLTGKQLDKILFITYYSCKKHDTRIALAYASIFSSLRQLSYKGGFSGTFDTIFRIDFLKLILAVDFSS